MKAVNKKKKMKICPFFSLLTEQHLERDKFMTPEEAKDYGIIDKVLEHPDPLEMTDNKDDC